jgi:aryl sulfotransferase
MNLLQAPIKEYRTWTEDSRRWSHYTPRSDDIVIATYPKCGTTWTQRIVASLVFNTPKPLPIMEASIWVDSTFFMPVDVMVAALEAQEHRRFLKSHLPFDGLPIYEEVKYIHVARDGRDAAMSWHNHVTGFQPGFVEVLDQIGRNDETIAKPFPRPHVDPADEFHRWLDESVVGEQTDGLPNTSYFHFERSWWNERHRPNVLLVHFNDLKSDLTGEMRRIAGFLEMDVEDAKMQQFVDAASFGSMRRDSAELTPGIENIFEGGAARFLNKGTNRRWEGIYRDADLATYQKKVTKSFTSECRHWLELGGSRLLQNP